MAKVIGAPPEVGTHFNPEEIKTIARASVGQQTLLSLAKEAIPNPLFMGSVKQRQELIQFIVDEISNTRFLKPDGHPKKKWRLFYPDQFKKLHYSGIDAPNTMSGAHDAAYCAASQAGREWGDEDAAKSDAYAAMHDASLKAKRGTLFGEVGELARKAVWKVAQRAAEMGAGDEAALYAQSIVVADLDFKHKRKHLAHVRERWDVWQKGYAFACDVKGVLYVGGLRPEKIKEMVEKRS